MYGPSDTTLELTKVHVDAIVSGHGPVDAYMRNTAVEFLQTLHTLCFNSLLMHTL